MFKTFPKMYDHHVNDSDDEESCDSDTDGDTISAIAEDFSLTNSEEENKQDNPLHHIVLSWVIPGKLTQLPCSMLPLFTGNT